VKDNQIDRTHSIVYQHTQRKGLGWLERNSRKLIKMLEQEGWTHVATKDDHFQFKHPVKSGRVTVPHPNKEIKKGTVMSIYLQAGWR
jgi:predicted RNA binding protein YcfA (HicA-like mRNA interferase family)